MIRKLIVAAALVLSIAAAAAAQDAVYYYNRAKKLADKAEGPIEEETPAGIKIKVKVDKGKETKVIDIPTGDITKVHYYVGPGNSGQFISPVNRVEGAAKLAGAKKAEQFEKALTAYKELGPILATYPNAKRYIDYKIAEVAVLRAQDDPTKRDDAIVALTSYKADHPGGWTIVPALKTLAKLYEDAGKPDDAARVYGELADVPGVAKELQNESTILVARMLLRNGKHADAQARLDKLEKAMSDGDAQRPFVRAYLAEAKIGQGKGEGTLKELEGAIKASSDGRLRGLAYNLIGDLHRTAGRAEEAFWAYLRVESQYNEDADQQAKALYYLGGSDGSDGLFDKVKKNPARSRDANKRLRDPKFAGSPYQKMLKAEKAEEPDPDDDPVEKDPKKDKDKKKEDKTDAGEKKDK